MERVGERLWPPILSMQYMEFGSQVSASASKYKAWLEEWQDSEMSAICCKGVSSQSGRAFASWSGRMSKETAGEEVS